MQPIVLDTTSSENSHNVLELLLQAAAKYHITDIHIPYTGVCYARRANTLEPIISESSGEPFTTTEGDFSKIVGQLQLQRAETQSKRVVFDSHNLQVRALYLQLAQSGQNELVILRIQSLTPPNLADIISDPDVITSLEDPHGLILVAGMIGSGKTSLASSICAEWARHGRHVFTVEDPIEYVIQTNAGRVTQVSPGLASGIISNQHNAVEQLSALSLRADIDGLFIGESRHAQTFRVALDAATTHEPCITTLHAGGFADAIVRCIGFAQHSMSLEMARFTVSQALHSILHAALTYNPDGKPIPMVAVLPFWSNPNIRKLFVDFEPVNLMDRIKGVMSDQDFRGRITYDDAAEKAKSQGATEESVARVLAHNTELPSYLL